MPPPAGDTALILAENGSWSSGSITDWPLSQLASYISMHNRFAGLIAAPYTPFTSNQVLNLDAISRYAELLASNNVTAAFVCGTTGELASLTLVERRQIAEKWIRSAQNRIRVIVHVGDTALASAQELARHAGENGAAAIGCMAPWFFKPETVEQLVTWCEAVASAAPSLPFYYYHMPSMNGVKLAAAQFMEAAGNRIPSFAGIKYSYEDLSELEECVRVSRGRWDVLMGRDELLFEGIARGATGAVGSTYNYAAPLYQKLLLSYSQGDHHAARVMQDRAVQMIEICNSVGVTHLSASKMLMRSLGVDCGHVRLPLAAPDVEAIQRLERNLDAAGLSDYFCRPLGGSLARSSGSQS